MLNKKSKYYYLLASLILSLILTACSDNSELPVSNTEASLTTSASESTGSTSDSSAFNYRYETSRAYTTTEETEPPPETTAETEAVTEAAIVTESTEQATTTETTTSTTTLSETTEETTTSETTTSETTAETTTVPPETSVATETKPAETTEAATKRQTTTTTTTTPETTTSIEEFDTDEIITTNAEFFSVLSAASKDLTKKLEIKIKSEKVYDSLTDEQVFELGIDTYKFTYGTRKGYEEGTMTIVYQDWFIASQAHKNGTASELKGNNKKIYDKAMEIIENNIKESDSDFEKVRKINNYLVQNTSYDLSYRDSSFTAYGALINGKAVCQGYTFAFKLIMDILGIDCISVVGEGTSSDGKITEPHSWNLVKLGGDWYQMDVTWNDPNEYPISTGQFIYFTANDRVFSERHSWNKSYYPSATASKYNYYKQMDLEMSSLSELQAEIIDGLGKGAGDFEYYCDFEIAKSDLSFIYDHVPFGYNFYEWITPYNNGNVLQIYIMSP